MAKGISYASYSVTPQQSVSRQPRRVQSNSQASSRSVWFRRGLLIAAAIALAGLIPLGWIALQTTILKNQTEKTI